MAKLPSEHLLSNNEDIVYFYNNAIFHRGIELKNRKAIKDIAKKYGIKINFLDFGKCHKFNPKENEIDIYDSNGGGNTEKFFRHLRNAFSHSYVELENDRLKLLDWNAYESGKKCKYAAKRISMHGDVDYASFKSMMDEFFSESSIIKAKKNKKSKKQETT